MTRRSHARTPPPRSNLRPVPRRPRGAHRDTRQRRPVDRWNPPHCGNQRHAHRPRRQLVSRGHPDRPRRRWSGCSPRCCAANPTAATSSSPRSKNSTIDVEATAFRALTDDHGWRRRARRIGLRARQRRRGDRRPRPSAVRRRHTGRPLAARRGALRAGGRTGPRRSITNWPRSRWPKAMTRPVVWSDGAFFPLDPREPHRTHCNDWSPGRRSPARPAARRPGRGS